ncbi:MAG TPA: glycosyltransferase [Gaiellales bacterium]|nr:glycosyltransferase [Gaiellales bacterium]
MHVLILSAPVGAGHDAAARGVADDLEASGATVEIDDGLALIGPTVHHLVVDGYRAQLEHAAWSWRVLYRITRSPRFIRMVGFVMSLLCHRRMLARIEASGCDRVVSAYPLVSAVLASMRRRGHLTVPCSTLVTDFDPHPAWVHPDLDANLSVGGGLASLTPMRPPVPTTPVDADLRRTVRKRLGVADGRRVALIVGGAWGVGNLQGAAEAAAEVPAVHPVVVTGRNHSLRARLERDPRLAEASILGFTDEMPALMDASDVLIQNAGGLTCLEGFAKGLPVVMFDPLPGHGEDNARQMAAAGLVSMADDAGALTRMLDDRTFWNDVAPIQAGTALLLFDRPSAAEHLAGQVELRCSAWTRSLRRSVAPVLSTLAVIGVFALRDAPDALAVARHHVEHTAGSIDHRVVHAVSAFAGECDEV